jgi:hypothetical protein
MDPSLQDLQTQIWAAQDAAAATADALKLQNTQSTLQIALLTAQGDATGALALQRKAELAALDPSLRGLQQQVYAAQDLATAKDNLVQAYKNESAALQQTIDKFRGFATTLRAFRDSLFAGADSGSQGYSSSLVQLMKQAGLASGGDETALGGGLQQSAQSFLDIATANASSLQDVQRARALVARYLDQAIGGANGQASAAQQQLDQMKTQVGALVDINDSVLTVAEAIKALTLLMFPASTAVPAPIVSGGFGTGSTGSGSGGQTMQGIFDKLTEIAASNETAAIAVNKVARIWSAADRGAGFAVVTDKGAPLGTVAA